MLCVTNDTRGDVHHCKNLPELYDLLHRLMWAEKNDKVSVKMGDDEGRPILSGRYGDILKFLSGDKDHCFAHAVTCKDHVYINDKIHKVAKVNFGNGAVVIITTVDGTEAILAPTSIVKLATPPCVTKNELQKYLFSTGTATFYDHNGTRINGQVMALRFRLRDVFDVEVRNTSSLETTIHTITVTE